MCYQALQVIMAFLAKGSTLLLEIKIPAIAKVANIMKSTFKTAMISSPSPVVVFVV
jgi:hypothetical protein